MFRIPSRAPNIYNIKVLQDDPNDGFGPSGDYYEQYVLLLQSREGGRGRESPG